MRKAFFPVKRETILGIAAIVGAGLALAACGGSSGSANGKRLIRVAYSSNFVFFSGTTAQQWWSGLARAFERQHPNATVQLVPIPGGYNDVVAKLDLLYRTPSTSPDVAQLPGSGQMGQYVSSGFLAPLDSYVANATWWSHFPSSVKAETTLQGHVYAVNQGENNGGLYYNIPMFKKAGIPVPWQPHSWADILAAAEKIHAVLPNVWPVWLQGGVAGGTEAFQYAGAQLIYGSSTPVIYDKYVIDSPGLQEVFNFYHQLAARNLQAPASVLGNPNALNTITLLVKQGKMAIAFGNNSLGQAWSHTTCAPCWPSASKTIGVAYTPTMNGQSPGHVSVLGGSELAMGADSPNKQLAWDFINLAEQSQYMLTSGFGAGWVAPDSSLWHDPAYTNFAPPYVSFFTRLLPGAPLLPELNNFTPWTEGFNEATGAIIANNISSNQALAMFKSYVTNQLGSGSVETIP